MFHVSKNEIITMNRGDTADFNVSLDIGSPLDGNYFEMQDGDLVKFRVMYPNSLFEDALIKKDCGFDKYDEESHSINIRLDSEDTNWLKSGCYYYEIKLYYTREGVETVDTINQRNKFYIIN